MITGSTATIRGRGGALLAGLLLAVGLIGLGPLGARAGSTPDELSAKAQSHYRKGQQHYADGNYEKAAEALRKAYALTPMPLLLYNISLAEWRAGHLDDALMMAMRARRQQLPPELRAKTDARIAAFGPVGTAQQIAGRLGDGGGGETSAGATDDVEDELAEPEGSSPSETGRASRFGGLGWVGIGTSALGAAGLAMAGIYDARVADAVRRMNRASENGNRNRAERIRNDDVVSNQKAGKLFLFAGGGLAASGLTLVVWDLATAPTVENEASAGMRIRPTIGVGRLGVRIRY